MAKDINMNRKPDQCTTDEKLGSNFRLPLADTRSPMLEQRSCLFVSGIVIARSIAAGETEKKPG